MLESESRFILSDTLPYELPIIFSNIKFAEYLSLNKDKISKITLEQVVDGKYSVPYKFNIIKDSKSDRVISLLNPVSEIQIIKFVSVFDKNIVNYCNLYGRYSLRIPSKVNPVYLSKKRKEELYKKVYQHAVLLSIDDLEKTISSSVYYESYFELLPYSRIHEFENSPSLMKTERRFRYSLKTDISDCFNSIYTHSIGWSYTGDKDIAKSKTNYNGIDSIFDKIMQKANYNETNGIVVGPNISRIFAEMIFAKIDNNIMNVLNSASENELYNNNLREGKHFQYYRYIDDIFVFANTSEELEVIFKVIKEEFRKFNLSINSDKTFIDERPFEFGRDWFVEVKELTSDLNMFYETFKGMCKTISDDVGNPNNLHRIDYNLLLKKIKRTLKSHISNQHRITNYLSSTIMNLSFKILGEINKLDDNHKDDIKKNSALHSYLINSVNLSTYLVSTNLNYTSVNNYFKLLSLIKRNFLDSAISIRIETKFNYTISDIVSIVEANITSTEVSNLIIMLSFMGGEINYQTLERGINNFSKNTSDLLNFVSLAYYINKLHDSHQRTDLIDKLNDIVEFKIKKFVNSGYFSNVNMKDKVQVVSKTIRSDHFYLMNAFYHFPELRDSTRKLIKQYLYNDTVSVIDDIEGLVKGFKDSFIRWDYKLDDALAILLINNKLSTQNSF